MAGLEDWVQYQNKRHLLTGRSDDQGAVERFAGQGLNELRQRARVWVQLGLQREALELNKQIQAKALENARFNQALDYMSNENKMSASNSAGQMGALIQAPLSLAYAKRLYNIL